MRNQDGAGSPARDRVVAQLIAAARALFAQRGPGNVSLREIASAADVNYGLIHQYVGTKDDLLRLVFRTASEDFAHHFAEAEDASAAVAFIMRPKSSEYVRMLAHVLLEGRDPAALVGRSPALLELGHRIESELGEESGADPRVQVAALTGVALGWGLFGSFVQKIAGLGDIPEDELTKTIYAMLRRAVVDL
ncbi:helix-turn-helix domain-containing protein [Saccharopolyspora sp. NPDC002686]|uniref:TetR/AcrR family transcriptional regulator n=1 Tax=Saccharopolyspora sp. NPDC002686 TaxID=3154541 RepID=UPI003329DD3A